MLLSRHFRSLGWGRVEDDPPYLHCISPPCISPSSPQQSPSRHWHILCFLDVASTCDVLQGALSTMPFGIRGSAQWLVHRWLNNVVGMPPLQSQSPLPHPSTSGWCSQIQWLCTHRQLSVEHDLLVKHDDGVAREYKRWVSITKSLNSRLNLRV